MTNTLHRYGNAEVFATTIVYSPSPPRPERPGLVPKLKRFLAMAVPFKPVNLGDSRHGGALRPSQHMNPSAHWRRNLAPDFQAVIDGVDAATTVAAVFDNREAAEDFLKAVKEADLGLSINVSTSIEGAKQCCCEATQPRHSVGYSLGFEGKTEKLPSTQVLTIATMCGHGVDTAPALPRR